ncbi:TIM-barrel domain-containing protein [Paenibacillus allorhizosphaerae]|uniref:Oligosaccharide 4-alpha-D-glucosyltransferase n=1 Tax=Paenibacillus allorhizosphaerae TaxID=2849866 RepID=A0ABM8VQA8_9BACL|nr:TIM-barrel domain-containing protein [Paenibacillus allorhizosphaerae]CAG7653936.1 Oligosaccharide 4-alpha-D-glucosyltransferase [Paenibacillus allorhizosphaerae]
MKVSSKLLQAEQKSHYLDLATDAAKYRIYLMNDNVIRIRCTFDEQFADEASYTLTMTAWDDKMDEMMEDRRRVETLPAQYEDLGHSLLLRTDQLRVIVHKQPFAIEITDPEGRVLHEDLKERSYVKDNHGRLYHYSCMSDADHFYGFGEKSGHLNKKKRRLRMHNVDTIGYDSEHTDPLYKHIPFYIKFNGATQAATGLFYHNSYDSTFDMGCERSGYWNKYSYFCADGGELDLFFMYGPEIKDVVRHYTDITGKTMMPTRYSLGYMGSTMYYTELDRDADKAILNFVDKCKAEGIPCDGFFMSSGYTTGGDGKRYVFNWNHDRFPDPRAFIAQMREKGVALAPNIKPGMLLTHPLYPKFDEAGAYVKDAAGDKSETDRYWGGQASFVDFTSPAGRQLWKEHLKSSFIELGVTSIWNDNNEYEINNPDALCEYEGEKKEISALRPIMPNLMAQMAKEAIAEAAPNTRPYIVNRAGFAGIQRYAQTWAGDNNTSWHSLKFNVPVILGMGLSGVANQGCDIGGFFGPAPEPELFVRWVQNGIFQPRFSIHSCNTDNTVTEPWMYPSYTAYIREAIRLRYRLVPYFYSLLHEASVEGSPVMRPMVYEFQNDPRTWEESFDFMLGRSILVANVLEQGATARKVYLPQGSEWIDWYSRQRYAGGQTIELAVSLESIPMFIRSGAIVPLAPGLQNIQNDRVEELRLLVEPSEKASFVLYEDDGVTNNYKNGDYLKTTVQVDTGRDTNITFRREGAYASSVKSIVIELLCKEIAPVQVMLQGRKLPMFLDPKAWEAAEEGWYYDLELKTAKIKYANSIETDYEIGVRFDVKDLISI